MSKKKRPLFFVGRIWWDVFGADFSVFFLWWKTGGEKGVIYGFSGKLWKRGFAVKSPGLDDGVLCGSSELSGRDVASV